MFGHIFNTAGRGSLFHRKVSASPLALCDVQISEVYNLGNLDRKELENLTSDGTVRRYIHVKKASDSKKTE
jgi:hypothetical protein